MSANGSSPEHTRLMSEEDFDALEAVLSSDVVPADCMDLEMLDGFLAGVLLSPRPIALERWLPEVWSAYGEDAGFGSGRALQEAIRLVKTYYNELVSTLGLDNEESACWEPFCFAVEEEDDLLLGEEWLEGFAQGLDLWPEDWEDDLDEAAATAVRDTLDEVLAPWSDEAADGADEETRLQWLAAVGEAVNDIYAHWRDLELSPPQRLDVSVATA